MKSLLKDLHVHYVRELDSKITKQTYEYWLLEHLRLNGLYWGSMALATLGSLDTLPKDQVEQFVMSCYDEQAGAFAAFPGHDAHVLTTLSALQILLIYDRFDALSPQKKDRIAAFVLRLRLPDGSFMGDSFGEIDTRFVFVSVFILTLLDRLSPAVADSAAHFILSCRNFDGGFGMYPGAESHAAQVYTCIGALALCDALDNVEEKTAAWLSERQVVGSGGFNGRPEKLPDVCYSWWVLLSLAALDKAHWINFVLDCQDLQAGGFADRPDNQTDVYHTCFALTGLSLMFAEKYGLAEVDPVMCLPKRCVGQINYYKRA
ncbi:terpenoid cyclases/Protein prenyltransferase [Metschnikowia bicuspidata var. bicuspidata NRRL YB-4993]|uniref:Geranylgeranyl transferase type-2 subunit beta n=1 Tax=Metschnikowia bicuspidata var. bicuspidata NRRL YB-4993 TaxID=869754 RepID=A0A1A0H8N2_9ASCO|nr:terpenoid cyclases/Protein prenyltransferase [Metschnikowia bicuspidata var. bicuspidata NRRL YB-4993]OBA20243.1 terpenoid cyclases/Protein prenyltransferase [Metschnikowia bicuspidata var. bicuspidata NRRL YB-4993]